MKAIAKPVDSYPSRIGVLDGWRAVSIALVLGAHLLPLGPKAWLLNEAVAATGMALFFILSGFLITSFLLDRPDPKAFLVRRALRILPLAWVGMAVGLWMDGARPEAWAAHLLFFANLPPFWLGAATSPFWSLCVEIHFYLAVALLVLIMGRKGLVALPVAGLAVTVLRVVSDTPISIVTHLRVDEILAGATLALAWHGGRLEFLCRVRGDVSLLAGLIACLVASHPAFPSLNYARPYLAALCVGVSLINLEGAPRRVLQSRALAYVAEISFALYVIHPLLRASWLGSGEGALKYLKRPVLFLVLWALAHLSTFRFERYFIELGRRLTGRGRPPDSARSAVAQS